MSKFQDFLKRTANKLTGSAINVKSERTTKIPARIVWTTDDELEFRREMAKAALRAAGVEPKALR